MPDRVRDVLIALAATWTERAEQLRTDGRARDAANLAALAADVGEAVARTPATPSGLLTPREAASWLSVSLRELYVLDLRYVKIGRSRRYDLRDLQQFADLNGDRPRLERSA